MLSSSSKRVSARARASSVLPTPVGPRKRNEPMGRLGSLMPARARTTASATARTASSWPTTRWCSSSSRWRSFCISPSISFETGMPVQRETTSAMSSSSTSSLRSRRPPPASACASAPSARARARRACRTAARPPGSGRRPASPCSISSLTSSMRLRSCRGRSMAAFSRSHCSRSVLACACRLGQLLLELRQALPRGGVGLLLQGLALDLELHDAAGDLVQLGRHRVDLRAQPRRRLVHEVDGLVGQEPVGDVAVRTARRPPPGRRP